MDFTKMNKVVATFKNAKKDLEFKKMGNVVQGEIIKVNGIFQSDTKFGLRYFLNLETSEGDFFNFGLPQGQNENCRNILNDVDSVNAINNGECGIIISSYYSKRFNKQCVNIEWVNIEPF